MPDQRKKKIRYIPNRHSPNKALSPRQTEKRAKAFEVLRIKRTSRRSLSSIARQKKISLPTIFRYAGEGFRKNRQTGRWDAKANDSFPRTMTMYERNVGPSEIEFLGSRKATIIGGYHDAVQLFIEEGDSTLLGFYEGMYVLDRHGKKRYLETDTFKLIEAYERIEEPEFYEIYHY